MEKRFWKWGLCPKTHILISILKCTALHCSAFTVRGANLNSTAASCALLFCTCRKGRFRLSLLCAGELQIDIGKIKHAQSKNTHYNMTTTTHDWNVPVHTYAHFAHNRCVPPDANFNLRLICFVCLSVWLFSVHIWQHGRLLTNEAALNVILTTWGESTIVIYCYWVDRTKKLLMCFASLSCQRLPVNVTHRPLKRT